ncbi:cobalamin biosynthesis protein [compost metagenome]
MAGALGIRLGGENVYHGVTSFRAYMGDKTRELVPDDIPKTAAMLTWVSNIWVILGTAVLLWWGGSLLWI